MKIKSSSKNEKGSVTLYVLVTMILLLVVIFSVYAKSKNKVIIEERQINAIQEQYGKDMENIDSIYEEVSEKDNEESNFDVTFLKVSNKQGYNIEDWTNENILVKVKYEDTGITSDKKVEVKEKSSGKITTYSYEDIIGEKVIIDENSEIIVYSGSKKQEYKLEKFDKEKPEILNFTNSSNENWTNKEVSLKWEIKEEVSGISKVQFSNNNSTWTDLGSSEWYGLNRKNQRNDSIYIRAIDNAGNISNVEGTNMKIDTTLPTVKLSPNGGTYTMPSSGNGKIQTKLSAQDGGESGLDILQYAWSISNTQEPENWKTFINGETVSKADCVAGKYYLWTKVTDKAGNRATNLKVSSAFTVNANNESTSLITISLTPTGWTNGNVTASITYGSTLTQGKKAGYGTSLSAAQSAATTAQASKVIATANGYVYAEATDSVGNKVTKTVQISNIDKEGPIIESAEVGTEYDYVDRVTIKANDVNKVTAYAVTQSTSLPSEDEWIDSYNLDLSQIEVKKEYGATWAKIFAHNNLSANELFTTDSEVLNTTSRYKFSRLSELENYRNSEGKFEFLLQYPNDTTQYNRWKQTDNPVTVTEPSGTGSEVALGYEAVHIDWSASYWGGLLKSTSPYCYIDGSVGHANWFFAIGAKHYHGNGIPSYNSATTATAVELWVRIDDLEKKAKDNITVKVGNIKENGTYYVWAKDTLQNVSNIVVNVNKIDKIAPTINSLTVNNQNPTNADVTLTVNASDLQSGLYEKAYGWNQRQSWSNSVTYKVSTNGTYNVYVIDEVGNLSTKSISVSNIDTTLPTVKLSPNGGTYTMPSSGNGKIQTKLSAQDGGESGLDILQYAWSTSNTQEPENWITFTNGETVSKADCVAGKYYLWTKVTDKAGNRATNLKVSSAFTVNANNESTSLITISLTPTGWTNGNVTASITYGSTLTQGKKAGYGTSLSMAQSAATTAQASKIIVTENGYVYAEATDSAGNKIVKYLQITSIDRTEPTVTLSSNGGTYIRPDGGTVTIQTKLTAQDTQSGLNILQYAWSTSNTQEPEDWTTFTNGENVSKSGCGLGKYYLWTKVTDKVGNRATNVKVSSVFLVSNAADGSYSGEKKVNIPHLGSNMELVQYDETSKSWVKDDFNNDYDYVAGDNKTDSKNSKWANAKVTTNVNGQNIDSYFVWIPRYAYKIDKTNKKISIKFIKGTGQEAIDGTICKYADDSSLNTATDYIIHPAFTKNANLGGGWDRELPGLWIGKYESARTDATSSSDGGNVTIKVQPNVKSFRTINIGNSYTRASQYAPNLNSHLLKNSEWGAVAYLTHSQYGRNGNQISINNDPNYITGKSAGNPDAGSSSPSYEYNTSQGVLASTTGNVYGIYDLSGGANEQVASYYIGGNTTDLDRGSSFTASRTSGKFYTMYEGSNESTSFKYGDATYETSDWNNDGSVFANTNYPYFSRGGIYTDNTLSGVFKYGTSTGTGISNLGFHLCLVIL